MRSKSIVVSGMTLLLVSPFASAQSVQPFSNTPTNPPPLGGQLPQGVVGRATGPVASPYPDTVYGMPDVAKHLELTPDQIQSLNAQSLQTQRMNRDNYSSLISMTPTERQKAKAQLDQQYMNSWYKQASTVMNGNQLSRYRQLLNQYQGFDALTNSDIQSRLNLTATQIERLNDQRIWNDAQLKEIRQVAATNPVRANQMYQGYVKERTQRLEALLSPGQQMVWAQLTGNPFAFKPQFLPEH